MAGFCGKCKLNFEGSKCPVCGRHKNTIPVIIISIVSIVVLAGIFGYSNYENQVNVLIDDTKTELESLTKENIVIQNINEEHEKEREWKNAMKKDYAFSNPVNENLNESIEITESDIERYKKEIHQLINEKRIKAGVAPLTFDPKINSIAQEYAEYIALHDHISHYDLNGDGVHERFEKVGYDCNPEYPNYYKMTSENIHVGHSSSNNNIPNKAVTGWVNSKGHTENIFDDEFTKHGLGIAVNDKEFHNVYIISNFC